MSHLEALAPASVGVCDDDRRPLDEGEVRVAVAYTGVCHSDVAAVAEGGSPPGSAMRCPASEPPQPRACSAPVTGRLR